MSTSVTTLSPDLYKTYKNSFHRRNNSGELDVFEAARYFSDSNENPSPIFSQKPIIEHKQRAQRVSRLSLDMSIMRNPIINPDKDNNLPNHTNQTRDNKKHKQPSSPGARLASFLNSLFNQTPLKKKKSSKSKYFEDEDEEEENSSCRRKRRNSIGDFRINTRNAGVRTPPLCENTHTKSKEVIFSPKNSENLKPILQNEINLKSESFGFSSSSSEEREFKKFSDDDGGGDSDSSSDLFDLPNHDLDFL